MKNCFVTKYAVDTQDANLKYFDALQLKIDWSLYTDQNLPIVVYSGGTYKPNFGGVGCTIVILSNGNIGTTSSHTATEYTITGSETANILLYPIDNSQPTEFLVKKRNNITIMGSGIANGIYMKYPLDQIYCPNYTGYGSILINFKAYTDGNDVDVSEFFESFGYKSNITTFRESAKNAGWKTFCNTKCLRDYTNLTSINYYLNVKSGNISYLSGLVNLTQLNLRSAGVEGNLASLGNLTKLTVLNINNSSISGSIEDFVAAQYSASTPRKSASGATRIQMYFDASTNITLNGTKTTISGKYLAWDDGGSAPSNIRFENS